jgi:hypothetical protein
MGRNCFSLNGLAGLFGLMKHAEISRYLPRIAGEFRAQFRGLPPDEI